jgi:hypothetical protein
MTKIIMPGGCYQGLKELARRRGLPLSALIALSDDNDPFLCSRPGRRLGGAEWFAELWTRLAIPDGVHLRRLHYLLVSTTGIVCPTGEPYLNTHKCWKLLLSASADARYLDLVPADAFVDRRAGEPVIYVPTDTGSDAFVQTLSSDPGSYDQTDSALLDYDPKQYEFPDLPSVWLAEPTVAEPYAIELWAEKSTMDDILLPIAQRRGVSLVTGVGELSITRCHGLVRRLREHRRKTRILYISDFDPAGDGMPVSVARKIEFFLQRDGDDLDIRLHPLILTADQVDEYRLPRAPIKDSDRRRAQFEERHGRGAVELDALEALHPGELRRIVEEAIDTYRAPLKKLRRAITRKASKVREQIGEIEQGVLDAHADAVAELQTKWETAQAEIGGHQEAISDIIEQCRERIAEHEQAIEAGLDAWRQDAEPVWREIARDLEAAAPKADDINWPQLEDADEEPDPLFDSRRSYLTQIARYKFHQGKPTARRRNGGAS